MNLTQLPNEIIRLIFSWVRLTGRDSRDAVRAERVRLQTLSNISRASRDCHQLVLPALHHTLFIRPDQNGKTLRKFLRRAANSPEVARSLRRLIVDYWETEHERAYGGRRHVLDFVEDKSLTLAIRKSGVPVELQDKILVQLETSLEDAQFAALLLLCPNVQRLELACHDLNFSRTQAFAVLTQAAKSRGSPVGDNPLLPNLRTLEIDSLDRARPMHLDSVVPIFWMPSLTKFHGTGFAQDTSSCPFPNDRSWALKTLHLDWAFVSHPSVRFILQSCASLETLRISWTFREGVSGDEAYWDVLSEALELYGQSLKVLSLKPGPIYQHEPTVQGRPFKSLQSMPVLKELEVSYEMLFGRLIEQTSSEGPEAISPAAVQSLSEMLPHSLRSLTVVDDRLKHYEPIDEQVRVLMLNSAFCDLKSIDLNRSKPLSLSQEVADLGWKKASTEELSWVYLTKD